MDLVLQIRTIFGCEHKNRKIQSKLQFERGLEIPALFCEACCDICSGCGAKTKTRIFNDLKLCDCCFSKYK